MLLTKPKKILFVCTGNICRSPMAEFLFRHLSKGTDLNHFEVYSRGTTPIPESPLHPVCRHLLEEMGIQNIHHHSQPLDHTAIKNADIVLTMEENQVEYLKNSFNEYEKKIFLLKEFVGLKGNVTDPMGQTEETFRQCFEEICAIVQKLIKQYHELPLMNKKGENSIPEGE